MAEMMGANGMVVVEAERERVLRDLDDDLELEPIPKLAMGL